MKNSIKNFNLGMSISKRKKDHIYFSHTLFAIFCMILFFLIIFYFYCSHKRNILLKQYKNVEKAKKQLEDSKINFKNLEKQYENLVNNSLNNIDDIYYYLEYISKIIPNDVRLNNFEYQQDKFVITGLSKKTTDLTNFLNLLKQNKIFKNISLAVSRTGIEGQDIISFHIKTYL